VHRRVHHRRLTCISCFWRARHALLERDSPSFYTSWGQGLRCSRLRRGTPKARSRWRRLPYWIYTPELARQDRILESFYSGATAKPYATNLNAFRCHTNKRLESLLAPLERSCAVRSTDFAARPICREVRFAWSRTAARRCFPRAGSRKNIKPTPVIPAIPAIRPVLPSIELSP
jgi:hypothetical protein